MLPPREGEISWDTIGRLLHAVIPPHGMPHPPGLKADTLRRPLPSTEDQMCPVTKRRPGALHKLYTPEEGMQLLSR
jgi:hypothetical protein